MNEIFKIASVALLTLAVGCGSDEGIEKNPGDSSSGDGATSLYTSYNGLVMAGYQAWFSTPDDGMGLDWTHYCGNSVGGAFEPGMETTTIEFWPDMREYEKKYLTSFTHQDGSGAYVYSSADYETTDLHFKWMQEYGLDGVFLQRFLTSVTSSDTKKAQRKTITGHVARAAEKYSRAWSIMYDLTGGSKEQVAQLADDWAELESQFNFSDPSVCQTYLHHNGKPLLAIYGIGFTDGREYDSADVLDLIKTINAEDKYSLMFSVPYRWQGSTCQSYYEQNDPSFWELMEYCDVLMTWAVGRYDYDTYDSESDGYLDIDIEWCKERGVAYSPLVYAGSSTGNLSNDPDGYDHRPRYKGQFMWNQAYKSYTHGSDALYIAMFDEVDEGTQILPCYHAADLPSNGNGEFVATEEGIETDHYLWLAGEAAKMFRGESGYSADRPIRESELN